MIQETCERPGLKRRLARLRQLFVGRFHRKFFREIELLRPFLPRRGVFLDVGANHGRFGLELARQCGDDCRVIAFEPLEYNYRIMERLIARRKNIEPFLMALSDREEHLDFYVPVSSDERLLHGGSFVAGRDDVSDISSSPDVFIHQTVEGERLDHFLERHPLSRIDFMKIDVEGYETQVIAGATRALKEFLPSIVMEVHGAMSYRAGFDPGGALELLAPLGYRFFDLGLGDRGSWSEDVDEVVRSVKGGTRGHDILCWHTDGPVPGKDPPRFPTEVSKTRFGERVRTPG